MTPFVIVAQPRTGSTLVCSLLNSVGGVRAIVEPINPIGHNHHMQPAKGPLVPQAMLDHIPTVMKILLNQDGLPWNLSNKMAYRAAGFKIMAHQIQALPTPEDFWRYLAEYKIKVLWILRHNILLQYISDLIVQQTRQAVCWDATPIQTRVTVNLNKLSESLKRINLEKRYLLDSLEQYNLEYKRLRYESFQHSFKPITGALEWLIGERHILTTKLMKQNSDRLIDRVVNYADVVRVTRELGFADLI